MSVMSRFITLPALLFQIALLGCQVDVKSQIVKLNDRRPDVRRASADALARKGNEMAVVPLINSLEDAEPEVVLSSIAALDRIGDTRAILPLVLLLGHNDPAVRFLSKMTLVHFGKKTVLPLLLAIPDQPAETQISIFDVLSVVGKNDPQVVSSLGQVVAGPFPDRVRMAAAGSLGKLGDIQGVQPLVLAIKDGTSPVRYTAADALTTIGEPAVEHLIGLLDSEDHDTVRLSIKALGKLGDSRAVMPLVEKLKSTRMEIKSASKSALARIGEPAVLPLIELSGSADVNHRQAASETLVRLGETAVAPLIERLKVDSLQSINTLSDILTKIGAPAVKPLILEVKDTNSRTRCLASKIIAAIGEPAVDPLIQQLQENEPEVLGRYVVLLGEIGHARAVEPLLNTMADGASEVQSLAAEALGRIGAPAVTPLIRAIVGEALKGEEQFRSESSRPMTEAGSTFQNRASKVLLTIGEPAVPPLIELMKHPGEVEKEIADKLLKQMGSLAVNDLIAVLGEKDPVVQIRASEVLIHIGSPSVASLIAVLETGIENQASQHDLDTTWRAVMILGEIGDRRAVETLIVALSHEEPVVRMLAVEALGNIGDRAAIAPLVELLSDWQTRHRAAGVLEKLKWKPSGVTDRIRYLIGKDEIAEVVRQGEIARETLVADLQSGKPRRMEYAVFAFVSLWGLNGISELIEQLDRNGNLPLAETYAGSGYDRLIAAAEDWAEHRGYDLPYKWDGSITIAP